MIFKLLALVLPLGLDTFSVSAAVGMIGVSPSRRLRLSLLFAGFEAGMPLIGLALGAPLGRGLGGAAEYVAIGVLLVVGLYLLLAGESDEEARVARLAERRGIGALLLGVSISLDELAIGFTLGLLRLPPGIVVILIALQAFVVTQLGLRLGGRLSEPLREGAERLAGAALSALALVLLTERLVG